MNRSDVLTGFLSWFIIGHLIFAALGVVELKTELGFYDLSIIPWLITAAASAILFIKRKIWIGAGVLGAIGINALAWMLMLPSWGMQGDTLELMGFPLPVGLLLIMKQL
jgi:hypothetical protein